MRLVSGLAILSLNPSLRMKLTAAYAAGNTDAHKSPVDERKRQSPAHPTDHQRESLELERPHSARHSSCLPMQLSGVELYSLLPNG